VQGITQAGPTISFASMAEHQRALADAILKDPNVESVSSFIGVDGTNNTLNSGRLLINLVPKDQRAEKHHRCDRRSGARSERRDGNLALSAAGAGPDDRFHREPRKYQFVLQAAKGSPRWINGCRN
jgi:multidrug efflux pump